MKLELKHLSPYLPYGLKFQCHELWEGEYEIITMEHVGGCVIDFENGEQYKIGTIKPILRPLSDLTKEIEHNGEKFVPINYFLGEDVDLILNAVQINDLRCLLQYNLMEILFGWHFDVFGLIEKGLAIDMNTIKTN